MEQNSSASVATEAPSQKATTDQLVRRRPAALQSPEKAARRAARPAEQRAEKRSRIPVSVIAVVMLAIGFAAGALVVRQRNRAFEQQVVVSVKSGENVTNITRDQLYSRLESSYGPAVISEMIQDDLRMQYARAKGTVATDKEVEERFQKERKQPDFLSSLQKQGLSQDAYKSLMKVRLSQLKTVGGDFEATEDEMKAYYQKNIDPNNPKALFYTPEKTNIGVILTNTKEDADKALAESERMGSNFAKAAAKYSVDSSKTSGGQVPTVVRGRTRVAKEKSFEDKIFAIPIGTTAGPLLRQNKWWLIRCYDKVSAKTIKYEDVRERCRDAVRSAKGELKKGPEIKAEFTKFARQAKIQAFWPRYKDVVKIAQ